MCACERAKPSIESEKRKWKPGRGATRNAERAMPRRQASKCKLGRHRSTGGGGDEKRRRPQSASSARAPPALIERVAAQNARQRSALTFVFRLRIYAVPRALLPTREALRLPCSRRRASRTTLTRAVKYSGRQLVDITAGLTHIHSSPVITSIAREVLQLRRRREVGLSRSLKSKFELFRISYLK